MKPTWTIESIPAFCITLERRADRWKRFQDQLGINGLSVKRFLGVDGKTLNLDTEDRITTLTKRNIKIKKRRSHEELDSIGGVGCALSHIAVWQWMVDNQQDVCLIFEDDAAVPPDFVQKANDCIRTSMVLQDSAHWDMWLLGGIWDDLSSIPKEPKESGVVRVGAFLLSHAYVITRRCAERFVKDAYPIHCHIDMWMSIYSFLNDLRLVGSTRFQMKQDQQAKTDIQSSEGCAICNVPTDFTKNQILLSKTDYYVARASQVALIGLLGYGVYQWYKK
jgi:GR25 family glycosyltransferase involved in LPS biosynthesis